MADIFGNNFGTVVKLKDGVSPAFVRLSEISDFRKGDRMIATSIQIQRNQIVQVVRSLQNLTYMYAFGEVPIKIIVSGWIFMNVCGGGKSQGIDTLNSFYEKNNIYTRKEPLSLTVGQVPFRAYLESMSINGEQNPYNYIGFSFGFSSIPKSDGK